ADVNLHSRQIEVWNGGLPEGYLLDRSGGYTVLESRHLPLGVLAPERFSVVSERYTLELGERLIFFSDGLVETTGSAGEMFGLSRFRSVLEMCRDPGAVFDAVTAALSGFARNASDANQQDDVTMVEIVMVPEEMFLASHPVPDI